MKKKKETVGEYLERKKNDPEYVALWTHKNEEIAHKEALSREAQVPLITALNGVGVRVQSVWDLVNTREPYSSALPILLEHLQMPYPDVVRDGIARALAVPEAKFGWRVFVDLYRKELGIRAKDALAVTLSAVADDEVIEELVALVRDPRNGTSRVLLLIALKRSTKQSAHETLRDMLTDPFLAKEAKALIGSRKNDS